MRCWLMWLCASFVLCGFASNEHALLSELAGCHNYCLQSVGEPGVTHQTFSDAKVGLEANTELHLRPLEPDHSEFTNKGPM
jgi:non-ribosomal peptide synthetase component E (peptide arylation enzyme)